MATEDQILLKLIIKGMDPSEVQALADSTQGDLNAKIKVYLDQLVGLYAQKNAAVTKDAKASAQDQIDAITAQVDAVNKVGRAHEIAANRASGAWHQVMEDLENITTVATGAWKVINEGYEHFKAFGEQIVRDTLINNALKGSIDQMRVATQGAIADIDLIAAKNRGYAKDLQFTDEQYGVIAATAKRYADVTGTDVKSALDSLIDGLSTGRTKMLQHVGVMVDAQKAAEDFAKAHDLIGEKMTAEQKLQALQEAAMVSMTEKTKEFGQEALTVAGVIEKAFAAVKNAVSGAAVAIGNIRLGDTGHDYSSAELADLKSRLPYGMKEGDAGFGQTDYGHALANQRAFRATQDAQRNAANEAEYQKNFGADNSTLNTEADQQGNLARRFQGLSSDDQRKLKTKDIPVDLEKGFDNFGVKRAGDTERQYQAVGADKGDQGDALDKTEAGFAAKNDKDFEEIVRKRADNLREIIDKGGGGAAGGLMARLLFGPDGPNTTYKHLDEFQKAALDSSNMIAGAGRKMTEALGSSIAASIAGDKAHATSVQKATHDILEGLAAQAIGRALYETASGVADLASYQYSSAAQHFEAAALFGAIGVGAGLGARAIGTGEAATPASGSGVSSSASGSGGFGGGSGSGGGNGQNQAPITINISNVLPGSEAEVGRQVAKALSAYTRESGSSITDLTTGKAAA